MNGQVIADGTEALQVSFADRQMMEGKGKDGKGKGKGKEAKGAGKTGKGKGKGKAAPGQPTYPYYPYTPEQIQVETGTSRTKTLEQELAESGLWDTEWSVGDIIGLDDTTEGANEGGNKPAKLVEFPEPEGSETLKEHLGQYKKAALNKECVLKSTKERLVKDNATGHQCLDWYVYAR
ncbi:PAB8, partial [Symbiodinium sp. CCMP2456]